MDKATCSCTGFRRTTERTSANQYLHTICIRQPLPCANGSKAKRVPPAPRSSCSTSSPTKAYKPSCNASYRRHASARISGSRQCEYVSRMRSEEHTSELKSLMRISSVAFCLKQNTKTHKLTIHTTIPNTL